MTTNANPLVSVVLPTDTYETIAPVLESLRRLEAPERLEVILVSNGADALRAAASPVTGFHSLRVCHTDTLAPMGAARAVGVEASSAPYVFIGETHSYLWPDALEKLLAALADGNADVVVPGFVNGNPTGPFSWAGFFHGYARWGWHLGAAKIEECPAYDCLVRREVLLAMGGSLPAGLHNGEILNKALGSQSRRLVFAPDARINHINIEESLPSVVEHFAIGYTIGSHRAASWSRIRRLSYTVGSVFVPAVLLIRHWSPIQSLCKMERIPILVWPALFLLFLAKAIGEAIAYAGIPIRSSEFIRAKYEIRRLDYASPCLPR
ncbi:MAG: glycosyltransferase [Verrucomicrobia bacterium]|nr:glycosyltransferase [Verrucomicrobiota bacterium]